MLDLYYLCTQNNNQQTETKMKIKQFFLMAASGLMATACGSVDNPLEDLINTQTVINVQAITLNETTLVTEVGDDAVQLIAEINANATDKSIKWKSSNPAVATVDETGMVSFVGSGRTVITAIATNGTDDEADDHKATCDVEVWKTIDLATITSDTEFTDCNTLTGTLDAINYPVKLSIADGSTVVLKDATIEGVDGYSYEWAGLDCLGDVTLILKATNTVRGFYKHYPGIHIAENKTLTIKGDGSLDASNNSGFGGGAGIGGGYGEIHCGNIVIESGTITAKSGYNSAGIGAGAYSNCGNITIKGGTIDATGGENGGAGIGCGQDGDCGHITISGATIINAKGDTQTVGQGAGIGGGLLSNCASITISNSTLTNVIGGKHAAGIGCGQEGSCGDITIKDCTIGTVEGGESAPGIGSGYWDSSCKDINITNCTIETIKGGKYGAGIGSGQKSDCGDITIKDCTIGTAEGGENAPSIGGGYWGSSCKDINLTNCTITTSKGSERAAGIGSGSDESSCDDITITNCTIGTIESGARGAGIGCGNLSKCGAITITGGEITQITGGEWAAGIGSGFGNDYTHSYSCGNIYITGGTIGTIKGGKYGAGIGSGYYNECNDIIISGGTISSVEGGQNGAGIGSGYASKCGKIIITTGVTSVTATKGTGSPNCIGKGTDESSEKPASCGTVTIGCTLDTDGNPVGGTTGFITSDSYTYPTP